MCVCVCNPFYLLSCHNSPKKIIMLARDNWLMTTFRLKCVSCVVYSQPWGTSLSRIVIIIFSTNVETVLSSCEALTYQWHCLFCDVFSLLDFLMLCLFVAIKIVISGGVYMSFKHWYDNCLNFTVIHKFGMNSCVLIKF